MKIDGKALAEAILTSVAAKISDLKGNGIVPTLAVILVGDDRESLAYIRQKQKITERIGGRFIFEHLPKTTTPKELAARIAMYNADPTVHGLIVQRPVPIAGDIRTILNTVKPQKDVDGFIPNSPFDVPIAKAVLDILQHIYHLSFSIGHFGDITAKKEQHPDFSTWLQSKSIVILGRGDTAGRPIAEALAKQHCTTSIIHSQTPNPKEIMKSADILISCVGRKEVVITHDIKPGVILMSVGLWRDTDGKLEGDYSEEEVKDIASYYTPTPGGVGPLNIASLMQNLLKACTIK